MEPWIQMIVTVACAVIASSGFWAYIQKKTDKSSAEKRLLIGLAHDRIIWLGMQYVERGWITQDEYENFHDYLYVPYHDSNGNGTGTKAMAEVERLPMHEHPLNKEEV